MNDDNTNMTIGFHRNRPADNDILMKIVPWEDVRFWALKSTDTPSEEVIRIMQKDMSIYIFDKKVTAEELVDIIRRGYHVDNN